MDLGAGGMVAQEQLRIASMTPNGLFISWAMPRKSSQRCELVRPLELSLHVDPRGDIFCDPFVARGFAGLVFRTVALSSMFNSEPFPFNKAAFPVDHESGRMNVPIKFS